jgi:hypothetical protein
MFNSYRVFLFVILSAALLIGSAVAAQGEPPCVGDPECYEPPAPGMPGSSSSPLTGGPAAPPWTGLGDGRLNPNPAEYYSLWCKHTFLEIWRGVPEGSLLQFVPIWLLDGLESDGGTVTIPNYGLTPFTITRQGDTITVAGNYGNLQPIAGQKSFSLSDCIARNDGPIGEPPPNNQPSTGFVSFTATACYGRDTEAVRQGRVPPDQICQDRPNRSVTG